ncbi:alpha/beta hydrolase fold [Thermostaphylospora chromogena]|uniref:Alpha/beta hydrolase fold n=1 Tax=Thermostaphylospora chromogena TaxID=35622 RepID=A0A1H1C787_9ACTN|nr:alpha/beta hydrolase fold [Thermostaphylospora chromogena]
MIGGVGGRGRLRLAAAAVAVALLGTGCAGAGEERPPSAETPPAPGLAPYYSQRLDWSGCGDGFECAELQVPLDYDRPDGERIEISVIRLPASGDRIGSLIINPGGPGGSGIEYARAARSVLTPRLRERFDTVGFDPRGVGRSTPVECLDDDELDDYVTLDASPDDADESEALREGAKAFAAGCREKSARLLPHVGTVDAARDMDVLRAALGDEGLTYLGKSYGTFLGAVYADLFPGKVRALALDGALDPRLSPLELNRTQAEGFEVAMRSFIEDCLGDEGCPFRSGDVDGALREVTDLLDRADREPLRNTTGDGREVTESWTALGILAPLYDRRSWPALRQALGEAFRGDGTTLLRMADLLVDRRGGGYSNQTEANMAINCVDHVYPEEDAYAEAAERAARLAPRFGEHVMWGSLPCAFWPAENSRSVDERLDAEGAPPILVIGTLRDPATPYRWSQALAEELSSGVLLSFDGDGHTAYFTGSSCVDRAVDTYLIDVKPPADGTTCPKIS